MCTDNLNLIGHHAIRIPYTASDRSLGIITVDLVNSNGLGVLPFQRLDLCAKEKMSDKRVKDQRPTRTGRMSRSSSSDRWETKSCESNRGDVLSLGPRKSLSLAVDGSCETDLIAS
ncbi:hypothetical protein POX_e06770 [Penicillium oxalicum]|uniref:hypothetical protein n=1 Tax=Penicillium oxalicum TaxID=69781 RepID=UPI0020B7D61D|nr:hypothetical protein POX_e06770 [Penicillium oxalicum]KAI2788749.1 hypothetical protein POX_e06770 [Penicillium oxalicum]